MSKYSCDLTLPDSYCETSIVALSRRFVQMWDKLSDASDIFGGDWEDLSSWRSVHGDGDPITVQRTDTGSVEAIFARAHSESEILEVAVMNRATDPILEIEMRVDPRPGRPSGILIGPAEPGSKGRYELPTELFSSQQMSQIVKVMTEVWDPLECKWSNPHYAARQKPTLKFGPNPCKSRFEWTTSLGWCTYLDTRTIPVPADVEWPDGTVVESFMNGVIIRIGDDPDAVDLDRLTAVRKALGWPYLVPGDEERRI